MNKEFVNGDIVDTLKGLGYINKYDEKLDKYTVVFAKDDCRVSPDKMDLVCGRGEAQYVKLYHKIRDWVDMVEDDEMSAFEFCDRINSLSVITEILPETYHVE
jgi:hypothetical protein